MAHVEASVEVAAPREVVWGLLADPTKHTEFGTFVHEVEVVTEGDAGAGTVYRERSGPGFMKSWSEWTISRFDPPRELVHVSHESSMDATATWTLTELGPDSTRVTQALDFQMVPKVRLLGRLLEMLFAERMTQKETNRMLQDIKQMAEAQAAQQQESLVDATLGKSINR